MKKETKILCLFFLLFFLVKVLFAFFVPSPTIFADEYAYTKMAQSFFYDGDFSIHFSDYPKFPKLYSIVLSFSFFFSQDMFVVYFLMKVINSFLTTLVLFPLFFLARDFFPFKKSLLIACVALLTGSLFTFSNYIMSENLFLPLVAFFIYTCYKALVTGEKKYFIFSGILLGLTIWTRILGVALVPLLGLCIFKEKKMLFSRILYHYIPLFLLILPLFLANISNNDSSLSGITGGYITLSFLSTTLTSNIFVFLNWFLLYAAFLMLGSGLFFALYALHLRSVSEEKLRHLRFLVGTLVFLALFTAASSSSAGYALLDTPFKSFLKGGLNGRYVAYTLPYILLLGWISYQRQKEQLRKKVVLLFSFVLLFGAQLSVYPLFPVNNSDLTLVGLVDLALSKSLEYLSGIYQIFYWPVFLFFLLAALILPWVIYYQRHSRFLLFSILSFLMFTSLISFSLTAGDSRTSYASSDQFIVAHWLADQQPSGVLFDKDSCSGRYHKSKLNTHLCSDMDISLLGFFINAPLTVGPVDTPGYSYIISNASLPFTPVYQQGNIIIYRRE